MYEQEKIKPYSDTGTDKGEQVEQMFDAIADRYDTLNHWMSFSIDRYWRKQAINQLAPHSPRTILDIATGTGDFAIQTAKQLRPTRLIGADISEGMIKIGREKVDREHLSDIITFEKEDCLSLSFADESFDIVLSLNGFHAFPDKDAAYTETSRVLKKGGVFCGCFYIAGEFGRTDWFVKHMYVPKGFFTPPFETKESLEDRLCGLYSEVEVHAVRAEGVFRCVK